VYPILISFAFRLFGVYSPNAVWFLLSINAICATLTTIVIFRIGIIVFSPQTAFLAGLFWAISPDTAAWAARNWESSLGALIATFTALWFYRLLGATQVYWSDLRPALGNMRPHHRYSACAVTSTCHILLPSKISGAQTAYIAYNPRHVAGAYPLDHSQLSRLS
jgi:hypothetical protein